MADENRSGRKLGVLELSALVVVGVIGVLVAFWVLHFIAGVFFEAIKLVVLVAVIAVVGWLLLRRGKH